jgi:hypothetical protein
VKWIGYAAAFVAGAVVGGLVVREVAIHKIEDPINGLADRIFGADSYASGATKTVVNSFLRN